VASLTLTSQNEIQVGASGNVPMLSDAIEPLIRRINWRFAADAKGALWDNKYYLAVPFDDSEVNNAVLVFDLINGEWAGHDEADGLEVQAWVVRPYNGRQRLFFVSPDGWVHLYEEDFEDTQAEPYLDLLLDPDDFEQGPVWGDTLQVNGGTVVTVANNSINVGELWGIEPNRAQAIENIYADQDGIGFASGWSAPNTTAERITNGVRFWSTNGIYPVLTAPLLGVRAVQGIATQQIESLFVTRGYSTDAPLMLKRLQELDLQLQTWNPSFTVSVIPEGVNEEREVAADVVRSRVIYDRPFDRAPWDKSNADDDFDEPYRQDYSVALEAAEEMELGSGVVLDRHQEARYRYRAVVTGRAMQIKISNTQGRIRVLGARIGVRPARQNRKGVNV
jgi:hypothetical protein